MPQKPPLPLPDPELKQGQMWKTSMGKIMITRNPEPAMSGEHNVEHNFEDAPEEHGFMYSHQGRWVHGPDQDPIAFHEQIDLFHDRRTEGRRDRPV
jgi:hypothetical protein